MSKASQHAATRAEARRRARLVARGELEAADPIAEAASPPSATGGGLLNRFFPPAPPLAGKPDPLAGFTATGIRRALFEPYWVLGRQPLVWLGAGTLWAVARMLTDDSATGIVASFVGFGSLVAAGWFGWQRPWLYGMAAALVGVLAFAVPATMALAERPEAAGFTLPQIYSGVVGTELVQLLFGLLGGWYGGYFRRRIAANPPPSSRAARRR